MTTYLEIFDESPPAEGSALKALKASAAKTPDASSLDDLFDVWRSAGTGSAPCRTLESNDFIAKVIGFDPRVSAAPAKPSASSIPVSATDDPLNVLQEKIAHEAAMRIVASMRRAALADIVKTRSAARRKYAADLAPVVATLQSDLLVKFKLEDRENREDLNAAFSSLLVEAVNFVDTAVSESR